MAGDWIKVEHATLHKAEVLRAAELLGISRRECLGLLLDFWAWLDQNARTDSVPFLSRLSVDEMLNCPGFAGAMESVGWIKWDDKNAGARISNYDNHNGKSAKTRALDQKKKSRNRPVSVPIVSRLCPAKTGTREEKSIKPSPDPLPNGIPSNGASATEGSEGSRVLDKDAKPTAETRPTADPWPRRIPEIADQRGLDQCAIAYGIDVRRKHFASYAELQGACFDARNQLREQREREAVRIATHEPRH